MLQFVQWIGIFLCPGHYCYPLTPYFNRLNIQPPDLFFYAFLPPLLVDSAIRIDFFMFRKVRGQGVDA